MKSHLKTVTHINNLGVSNQLHFQKNTIFCPRALVIVAGKGVSETQMRKEPQKVTKIRNMLTNMIFLARNLVIKEVYQVIIHAVRNSIRAGIKKK